VQNARRIPVAILVAAAFFAAGCAVHHHEHRPAPPVLVHEPGPPPHAPAHGYRHKQHRDGVELVFDTKMGVYVVVGHVDHWFCDDHYYRTAHGAWYVASRFDGPWKVVEVSGLPAGLRVYHGAKVKGKGKAKGHAKH
jgi:hypothetical protein